MTPLSGKTALVTDASRGIGRATGLALARAGAQVLIHHCSDDRAAQDVVGEIRAVGGHAERIAGDLGKPDGPHVLARRVRAIVGARLDILVANAAPGDAGAIGETGIDAFNALLALNIRAPYFLVQQLLPAMCKGSSIVLVSSMPPVASVESRGTVSAYVATHGAISAMVVHFAATLGERGIRINAVTAGTQQPDDVARTIVFLSSGDARWITGGTMRSDVPCTCVHSPDPMDN